MTCHDCTRAQQGPWRSYRDDCAECDVRWIANVDSAERDGVYEQIAQQVTPGALARIRELVGNEILRQRLLREGAKA